MSMIEDEALAIYSASKELQTAITKAVDAMNKVSADMGGRNTELLTALTRVEALPKTAIGPLKTAAEAGAATGVKNSLTAETEAISEAVGGAVKRMNDIKAPVIRDRFMWSMFGAIVGASLPVMLFGSLIYFEKLPVKVALDTKSIAAAILEDMHQQSQQPTPRKKK